MKHQRISVDANVMMGKPCIKNTRIPVEQLLRELSGGMTVSDILDAHPSLINEDIQAALDYAADVVHQVWLTTQPSLLGEARNALPGR